MRHMKNMRNEPNYNEIIKCLTNEKSGKSKNEGQVVNFKVKGLLYIPNVWHNFITSRIFPQTNTCAVTRERAILNFAILQNIKFDVGMNIEEEI